MKKLVTLAALALAMGTLLLPTTAKAQSSFQFRFQGLSVVAFFSSHDPVDLCVVNDVFVFATTDRFQEPPGPSNPVTFAFVTIVRFNECTEEFLLAAVGDAFDPVFRIDRQLASASLTQTFSAEDVFSGSVFDVYVDLSWTGTDDVTRVNTHFHAQGAGFVFNTHFNGTRREAVASGSVSDGVTDFTGGEPGECDPREPGACPMLISASSGRVGVAIG